MAAPAISSIATDKSSYNTGDTIIVTITYAAGTSLQPGTTKTVTISGTATDQTTGESDSMSGSVTLVSPGTETSDPTTVAVTDSDGRSYTKQSDDGATAVFTAVA